jgi:hypothetical protein
MTAQATTAKTKTAKKPKLAPIHRLEAGGTVYLDCSHGPDDVKYQILEVLGDVLGYHEARRFSYVFPVSELMPYRDQIAQEFNNYGVDTESAASKYKPFLTILDEFIEEVKGQLSEKIERGSVEFGDLPYLLLKGTEVTTLHDGETLGGVIESIRLVKSFFGVYYKIQMKVISNVFGSIQDGTYETQLGYYAGLQKINALPVRPVSEEEKAELTLRGQKFREYATGAHYIQYKGQLTRSSWWSNRRFRADGRAMLDVSSFSQVDNNQFSSEQSASGLDRDREDRGNKKTDMLIPEDQLWRTYPYLYGFSLSAKQWGRMAVSGLSDIAFRTDAFEKLVLPEEDKELVKAIVQDEGGDFSDLIDGKGGGSIFLLHGPPGQGKTLTAEAIAEELQRPLYSISVGELGTSPDSLEDTLREILDVATVWNAVLLLDEADIFLEERDEKDIVRNAMVGVFLRLLEYHQGVLFLTTNRVKNIDKAFYSRISIGLRFGDATVDKRRAIWTNLTSAAGVTGLDLDKLAEHDLNGRQIKNVIKLAIKLARAKGNQVDNALVDNVIARTSNFTNEEQAGDTGR